MSATDAQDWFDLVEGEEEIAHGDEMWMRQVHPNRWHGTIPSALSFRQSSGDKGKLSGSRATIQTREGAYRHHVNLAGSRAGRGACR